jgi:hypothetical protein
MSTTTIADLLDRAESLARSLRATGAETTNDQWRAFDSTTYRLLHELVGPERIGNHDQAISHARLGRVVNDYPSPLTTPNPQTTYNAQQAASHLGVSPATVIAQIRRQRLPATYDGRKYSIKATDLPGAGDVQQADPVSTHPVDRLSCTLGALADIAVAERSRTTTIPGFDPLRDDAQVSPVMARVLAITVAAARHGLANIPLQNANRPLAIAQYAEHALDALGDVDRPTQLNCVASFAPPSQPRGPNEELEAALRGWVTSARTELARTVPSTDVLRDIANQARHLYAVTAAVVTVSTPAAPASEEAGRAVHAELRQAAEVMHALSRQWEMVTTATRPGHEYVTATTTLHTQLNAIQQDSLSWSNHNNSARRINVDQAMTDLRYATTDLSELTHTAAQLPEPLIRSGLLFAPARILPSTMERLHDRNHGKYVAIELTEGADVINAAQAGASAALQVRATLEQLVRPSATAELPGQTPSARSSNQELKPIAGLSGPDLY